MNLLRKLFGGSEPQSSKQKFDLERCSAVYEEKREQWGPLDSELRWSKHKYDEQFPDAIVGYVLAHLGDKIELTDENFRDHASGEEEELESVFAGEKLRRGVVVGPTAETLGALHASIEDTVRRSGLPGVEDVPFEIWAQTYDNSASIQVVFYVGLECPTYTFKLSGDRLVLTNLMDDELFEHGVRFHRGN